MKPPELKYVGYFGDTDPVAYGGGFVYTDATGVYQPHVEYIEPAASGTTAEVITMAKKTHCPHKFVPFKWDETGMRVILSKCKFCGKTKR